MNSFPQVNVDRMLEQRPDQFETNSTGEIDLTKWDFCSIYQITQNKGWLTGVGMEYRSDFTRMEQPAIY